MSESVGSSEFLLGIEEYLRFLENDKEADALHSLSRTIHNPQSCVTSFMQDLSSRLKDQNKPLADLLHGIVKSNADTSTHKIILQYIGKTTGVDKNMADLSLSIQRALNSDNFEDEFIKAYFSMLDRYFQSDKIFRGINNYIKENLDRSVINDAFSRSQIKSKIWLIDELLKIESNYDNVLVMAGWFGQLKSIYDKKLTYAKMRVVEIDKLACEISDYIFNLANLQGYKVKSVLADINNLTCYKNGYEWDVTNFKEGTNYKEKFLPDLIINTSAEHMTEEWYNQIRFKEMESNPIVAIQSNNMFDLDEHVNCVHSVSHMKKKFPMKEVLFEGELQLKGYKRVMLIGRP